MKKETKKKVGSIVVATTILLSGIPNAVLAKDNNYTNAQTTNFDNKEIQVIYNGEKIEFDQPPIMEDDRTKVPFRKVFESMGCIVYYNNNENKIMALTKEGDILTHTIGTNEFNFNGEVKTFDSSSTIVNDRTLVPLRAVAETLSANVNWDDKTKTVNIQKQEKQLDEIEKEIMNYVLDVNFNPKDTKRYVAYKKQHPELDIKQVIIDVNMDMDKELVPYTYGSNSSSVYYGPKKEDIETIDNPDDFMSLINKFNILPKDYEPSNLVNYKSKGYGMGYYQLKDIVTNYADSLINDATNQGLKMEVCIAYENYIVSDSYFNALLTALSVGDNDIQYAYNRYPQKDTSELRTGLSIIFNSTAEFLEERLYDLNEKGQLKSYQINDYNVLEDEILRNKKSEQWLRENAHKYGFIERYQKEKANITKYEYSPNFYRFVGIEIATQMHNEGLCFEEYWAKYLNPVVNNEKYSIEIESTQKVLSKY